MCVVEVMSLNFPEGTRFLFTHLTCVVLLTSRRVQKCYDLVRPSS